MQAQLTTEFVIGTTYGYLFQKAGHWVEHLIRDGKKSTTPDELNIELLDGRFYGKGEEKNRFLSCQYRGRQQERQ